MQLSIPRQVRRPLALTPLIDVVFLLLLFFMLASTFQKYGEVDLATPGTGVGAAKALRPALLRIHEDGRIDFNARTIEKDELAAVLSDLASSEDGRLLVQVRPGASTQAMIDVLDQVRTSGVQRVMVAR